MILVAAAGCQGPHADIENVAARYQFQNVRAIGSFDEWPFILDVLKSHAIDRNVAGFPTNFRAVGGIEIRDYTARLTVARLNDLNRIHADLDALAEKQFGKERVEFRLLEARANLKYRSVYVTAELEITVRGITDPKATLTLFLHSGEKSDVPVSAAGSWSARIKLQPGRRFIYGLSTDRPSGVRKYFRIDVVSQQSEAVAESEFERLRAEDR